MDPSTQASSSRSSLSEEKRRPERSSRSRNIFSSLINRSSRVQPLNRNEKHRMNAGMQSASTSSLSSLIKTKGVHDAPDTEYIDVLDDVIPLRSGLSAAQDYFIVPGYGQMSKSRMENAVADARGRGKRSSSKDAPVPVQTFYGKYLL